MIPTAPTARHLEILQHSLGISRGRDQPYRNHFAASTGTDDYKLCEELVGMGLMEVGDPLTYGRYFHVTNQGVEVASP